MGIYKLDIAEKPFGCTDVGECTPGSRSFNLNSDSRAIRSCWISASSAAATDQKVIDIDADDTVGLIEDTILELRHGIAVAQLGQSGRTGTRPAVLVSFRTESVEDGKRILKALLQLHVEDKSTSPRKKAVTALN